MLEHFFILEANCYQNEKLLLHNWPSGRTTPPLGLFIELPLLVGSGKSVNY